MDNMVKQNLEIIPNNYQFSTRLIGILLGFMISPFLVLISNSMGRILVHQLIFKNNLKILWHRYLKYRPRAK